jgi:protoporphyrinogen oxidase
VSDVMVIGGGLSGLAAAWELEQQNIPYTLIEVKGRLGGSIHSTRQAGFVIDGGPFILYQSRPWPWLAALDLEDALYPVADLPSGGQLVAFKDGTQTLVDALARQLTSGRIMPRMSVSTLGQVDDQFAICLENGMVLSGAALIVAAPARFAERMFYTFVPEINQKLLDFRYDTITRVSLGYAQGAITLPIVPPWDNAFVFGRWTDHPARVPDGQVLVQVGLRCSPERATPASLIAEVQKDLGWPATHTIAQVDYWPESHCLYNQAHDALLDAIDAHLPAAVALIGSDYRGFHVEDRMEQGRAAAQHIAQWLRGR